MAKDNDVTVKVPALNHDAVATKIMNFSNLPEFKTITENMEDEQKMLKRNLSEINGSFVPIVEDEHLWGLFKTNNYKESITQVYDRMKKFSKSALGAIKNTNDNLRSTLGLLTILARTEKDIYQIIDDSDLKIQDITEIIQEICDKNNIKDEKVKDVLEQTFKRSYTLRDRINALRLQFDERLGTIEKHFDEMESEYEAKEKHLQNISEQCETDIAAAVNESMQQCQSYIDAEIQKSIDTLNDLKDAAQKNIEAIEILKQDLRKELVELIQNQNTQITSLEERCRKLEHKTFWEKPSVIATSLILSIVGCAIALFSLLC